MKVKEFIEELRKFNPEATVSLICSETVCISYISEQGATPMTTKHIFIEGADDEYL